MKDEKIKKFYSMASEKLEGEYKIILEPNRVINKEWIEYDKVKWELEETLDKLVEELIQNKELSFESKLLEIYKHICLEYIYDDNVLYFFKRDESDLNNIKYIAVDWYGRIVEKQWIENRKKHNRRICYEFSRMYAKAINMILEKESTDSEAFMIGDVDNLHYMVGLVTNEYSVILDLDDFNSIKDLTRLKLGLTLKGITILEDKSNKIKNAINNFNKGKDEELKEIEIAKIKFEKDKIKYFTEIVNILKKYDLDFQGFCEYIRKLIENEEFKVDKIWKEVIGAKEKRYARCLIFKIDGYTYLIDSIEQIIQKIEIEKLDTKIFVLDPQENYYSYFGG